MALAEEERDACPKCGMPKAFCREAEDGRQRWGVREDFCWVTFRMAQRKPKLNQDGTVSAVEKATIVSPTIRDGYEVNLFAGLELDEAPQTDDTDPATAPADES